MTKVLQLNDVVAGYGRGPDILKGVNLELSAGEIKCIIGPNGAGKSTVLNAIAGVLKLRSGKIIFDEKDISSLEAFEIMRSGISFLPQDRALFRMMSVSENLRMAGYSIKDKRELRDRIDSVLVTFPILKKRLSQLAGTMSGGEQQQLIFARAAIVQPKVILIDEPSLGLAPAIVQQAFDYIQKIASEGVSILLVEQNAFRGLESSHTGTVMDLGNIVFERPAAEVMSDDRIRDLYLGRRETK